MDLANSETGRASRERSNSDTPLLKLPAELLNKIYDSYLPKGRLLPINCSRAFAAATFSCRKLRRDLLPMLYGRNVIVLNFKTSSERTYARAALARLDAVAFSTMQKIRVLGPLGCKQMRECGRGLNACTVMNGVTIDVDFATSSISPKKRVDEGCRNCHSREWQVSKTRDWLAKLDVVDGKIQLTKRSLSATLPVALTLD